MNSRSKTRRAQPASKARVLHLYDGTGWTCDVPVTAEQWALYKRAARIERMRIGPWLMRAIEWGAASLIAKHLNDEPKSDSTAHKGNNA